MNVAKTSLIEQLVSEYSDSSGEFPRILSIVSESSGFELKLEVTEKLDGFRGHFPGNPVLAGIVQLHWAARFSSQLFGYQGVPVEIKQLKFKKVVQPPASLSLILRHPTVLQVYFEFFSDQLSNSSGQMVFGQNSS